LPPLLLALDTGSPIVSVAVGRAARTAPQASASTALIGLIDGALADAGAERGDLEGIVALRGPGSFTGLRIGLATALGIAQALAIPATAVPTMELLATLGGEGDRCFGAVRGLRGRWFVQQRDEAAPFTLLTDEIASLAPATVVGFDLQSPPPAGVSFVTPPPLAAPLLRFAAAGVVWRPETLLDPLYLASSVLAIRQESDPALLATLDARSFVRPWREDQIAASLQDVGSLALVAADAGTPVGYALFRRTADDEAELLRVAVDPAHRRRGLASRMVELALAQLATHGVRSAFLEVEAANTPALALYRRLGFEAAGRRAGYYAGSGDAVVMRRTSR
jgi:ribosomal-protein-alanine N-acetyltransferase